MTHSGTMMQEQPMQPMQQMNHIYPSASTSQGHSLQNMTLPALQMALEEYTRRTGLPGIPALPAVLAFPHQAQSNQLQGPPNPPARKDEEKTFAERYPARRT